MSTITRDMIEAGEDALIDVLSGVDYVMPIDGMERVLTAALSASPSPEALPASGVRTGAEMIARHRFRLDADNNTAEVDSNGLAEEIDAALASLASDASPRGEGLLIDRERLREKIAADPDLEYEVRPAHPAPATVESVDTLKVRLGSYAITEEYDFPGDAEEFCGYWCHECREHVEADGTGHGKHCPCHGVAPSTPRAVKVRAALAPATEGRKG